MWKEFLPALSSVCLLVAAVQSVSADTTIPATSLKFRGAGIELYTHNQATKITDIAIQNPLIAALLPANTKDLVTINNEVTTVGAKLDYWVNPHLKVFGGISEVTGEANVNLSALPGLGLSDLVFDADGTLYNAGATLATQQGRYFSALTYVHTRVDWDAGIKDGTVNTLIPSVGILTGVGAFDVGAIYQLATLDYAGTLVLPGLGEVATEVRGETADTLAYRVGYYTPVGNDLYLSASAGFGGWEEARLEVSKRF
ncbi:MAG: hypothetical protein BWK73_34405 [Thiothrix lacustris]|uniref:Uncharacterized protein n=1 Tax=Thiothrix lacustris TaxID=525917 RepID=A0A1Y1QGZ0_9GAMM|nr:MAG: hypothetical protein BWK73_34405 [Thiothrix lacustris]